MQFDKRHFFFYVNTVHVFDVLYLYVFFLFWEVINPTGLLFSMCHSCRTGTECGALLMHTAPRFCFLFARNTVPLHMCNVYGWCTFKKCCQDSVSRSVSAPYSLHTSRTLWIINKSFENRQMINEMYQYERRHCSSWQHCLIIVMTLGWIQKDSH